MRTRTPKSAGAAKKTPPPKKDAAAAAAKTPDAATAKTPETETAKTPESATGKAILRSAKAAKGAVATPKSADTSNPVVTPAAADPTPESNAVEEAPAIPAAETKPISAVTKSSQKKPMKTKSSPSSLTKAVAANPAEANDAKVAAEEEKMKVEEVQEAEVEEAEEAKMEEVKMVDATSEQRENLAVEEKSDYGVKENTLKEQETSVTPAAEPVIEDVPVRDGAEFSVNDKAKEDVDNEAEGQENLEDPGDEELVAGVEELSDKGETAALEEEEQIADEGGATTIEEEEQIADEGGATTLEEEEQIQILDMAKQRKVKKEQEIFVGGLDRDAVEEDIRKAFEKIGEVLEVRLHKDFVTNKNKGYAFVKFANKEQANKALTNMKNPIIRGKRCGIAASEDNDTLFLGNVCNTWTKEAIKQKLKDYGVEGVEGITLVEDTQNEGLSRGFAFLDFSCHADAMLAYKRLQKPDVIFGHPERTVKVAFAEPLREPDAGVMAQVKSVFVDGMPPYWDEDRVKEQFKGYGEIERVVLARNMPTAKRNDFGFVNFATHEAAVACIEALNNTELGDGKSKVRVRARLANPLPKTQAVKGGMRGGFRIGHPGSFSRFGRGFGRGRFPYSRGGFYGGRGFHPRGRGQGGRFMLSHNSFDMPQSEFYGRRPFGGRGLHAGGRRGSFRNAYESPVGEFPLHSSARGGAFGRGRGRGFLARRQPFPIEEEFGGPFDGHPFGEDSYFNADVGRGIKRPFSMMEHDPGYMEPPSRLHRRYHFADGGNAHYRDMPLRPAGDPYGDYYGSDFSDFGPSGYPSFYGSEQSGDGYYY